MRNQFNPSTKTKRLANIIHNNKPHEPEGDILEFEFYMVYGNIRKYMAPLFQKIGDSGKVWIKGKIDRRTGKVVDVGFGKIS